MPYAPINVHLYRCNECHTVQAVEVSARTHAGISYNCSCGGSGWTRIKVAN